MTEPPETQLTTQSKTMLEAIKPTKLKPSKEQLTAFANQLKEMVGIVDSITVHCDEIILRLPTLKVKFKK